MARLAIEALRGELDAAGRAQVSLASGVVNTDGFGAGWHAPEDEEPAVYRSDGPLGSDRSFAGIDPRITARTI